MWREGPALARAVETTRTIKIGKTNLECPLKSMRYQNVEGGSGAGKRRLRRREQSNSQNEPGMSAEISEIPKCGGRVWGWLQPPRTDDPSNLQHVPEGVLTEN